MLGPWLAVEETMAGLFPPLPLPLLSRNGSNPDQVLHDVL